MTPGSGKRGKRPQRGVAVAFVLTVLATWGVVRTGSVDDLTAGVLVIALALWTGLAVLLGAILRAAHLGTSLATGGLIAFLTLLATESHQPLFGLPFREPVWSAGIVLLLLAVWARHAVRGATPGRLLIAASGLGWGFLISSSIFRILQRGPFGVHWGLAAAVLLAVPLAILVPGGAGWVLWRLWRSVRAGPGIAASVGDKIQALQSEPRWPQFRLRTLLVIVLVLSLPLSWVRTGLDRARRRQRAAEVIEAAGGGAQWYKKHTPYWSRRLGLEYLYQDVRLVDLSNMDSYEDVHDLGLSSTTVTDNEVAGLKVLTNLNALRLCGAQVTDAGLAHLSEMEDMQDLRLDGTRVTDAGLAHLKSMTKLGYLALDDTQITDSGLKHLAGLHDLSDLLFRGTPITGPGLEHLHGLTRLQRLALSNTQIDDAGMKYLAKLPNCPGLELVLSGTRITDRGLVHLRGLTNLHLLKLNQTRVGDAGLKHLSGLVELRQLYLSGTRVTDAGLVHLKTLPNLVTLDLSNTQVTDAGLESLESIASLAFLKVQGTSVTVEGAKRFRSLSSTQITW